jgi:hypothetical protein
MPQLRTLSDECGYISQGLVFSEDFSLQSRSYYYASLIEQDIPLQGPHNPGFTIFLGLYMKLFGYNERNIVFMNFMLLSALILGYFFFNDIYFKKRAAGLFGVVLLICAPLINSYATIIMAEISVLVSTFFLIWLMFFFQPTKHKHLYYLGVFLCFWCCYLLRENIIFLLPIFFIHRFRKTTLKETLSLILLCALFIPAVYLLTRDKIQYTEGFMYRLLYESDGITSMVKMIFDNFIHNVRMTGSHFPYPLYNWNKLTFYFLTILGLLSYPSLNDKEKPVYRVIVPFFLINTLMLFCFYDNFDFRGLRSSIQFIPFFLLLSINSTFNDLRSKGWLRKTISISMLLLLSVGFIGTNHKVIRHKQTDGSLTMPQKMAIRLYEKHLAGQDSPTILTDNGLYRILLIYPQSSVIFAEYEEINSMTFKVVNSKMNFDYIFYNGREHELFLESGFKLVDITPVGRVYKASRTLASTM